MSKRYFVFTLMKMAVIVDLEMDQVAPTNSVYCHVIECEGRRGLGC
jgi:hypothetical protein